MHCNSSECPLRLFHPSGTDHLVGFLHIAQPVEVDLLLVHLEYLPHVVLPLLVSSIDVAVLYFCYAVLFLLKKFSRPAARTYAK